MPAAIELIDIHKRFGAVHANKSVNLRVEKGSVHGIVGENGAGKSTLMSILYGFYEADQGEIRVNGEPVRLRSSAAAIKCGIGMVHQHFMLVEPMSVIENVILGAEAGSLLATSLDAARGKLKTLADDYGLNVDPSAIVGELSVGLQQRVEIIKALSRDAEILILDEPTAVLTPAEADQLFRMVRALKARGKTVLLITHKLREIMDVTDTVSVMRRGEMVATLKTAETSPAEIATLMVGRKVLLNVEKSPRAAGEILLKVENLVVRDLKGVARVDGASFEIRAGEIVGLAGVAGNGQSELLEALAGVTRPASGHVYLKGEEITGLDPKRLRARKLFHVPEDRHRVGLVMAFEQHESALLGYQHDPGMGHGPLLDIQEVRADATAKIAGYDIRPADCRIKTANFSGGNQQKIVLAREIERAPTVLLVGQPTRGVDIGAIEFIHKRLVALRDAGVGILLVSVELEEIMNLSDRILVMCGGRITGERLPAGTNEQDLGLLMAGVSERAA
jgi:general nucleoside transport system ATP-binding protein